MAECLFRDKLVRRGLEDRFRIDSAGTGGWHAGDPPDARMRRTAARHGLVLEGSARQVTRGDFSRFDHIVCMDGDNHANLLEMGAPTARLLLLLEGDPATRRTEVPDPYYGEGDGFETVYGLVDSACEVLLDVLLEDDEG